MGESAFREKILEIFNTNQVPIYNFLYLNNQKRLIETSTIWSFQIDVYHNESVFSLVEDLKNILTNNKIKIETINEVQNDPSGLFRTIITLTFTVDNLKKKIY